jgi:hypothetical protein
MVNFGRIRRTTGIACMHGVRELMAGDRYDSRTYASIGDSLYTHGENKVYEPPNTKEPAML